MNWLTENWIWIAVAVGGFFLLTRMHRMGGKAGMGGMGGCGGGHGASGNGNSTTMPPDARGADRGTTIDAVSGHALPSGGAAASTVFHGQAYYFESRENRDAFESDPDKYLAATPQAGRALAPAGDGLHRHHGC
jgi:YHS domain-containing protein